MDGLSGGGGFVSLRSNASGDVMTTYLPLATISFAAAALCFGLTYRALRRPDAGRWTDFDLLPELLTVWLTGLIAMAITGHVAFGLDWQDEIATLGMTKALGYAALDLAGLVVFVALVRFTNRRSAAAPAATVVPFTPGPQPSPANTPTRPKHRKAA